MYDIPLFQYEREDNRRVDLEVVMVRARKGGRTSWPLPENKKRFYLNLKMFAQTLSEFLIILDKIRWMDYDLIDI